MSGALPSISIGVVGCGAIAELYHLPALVGNPVTRGKFWLADTRCDRRQEMESQFQAAGGCCDYRDLAVHVQGVIVATPPASHFEICKFFLESGIHVLCEKPLTEDSNEAKRLVDSAREHGAHLAVNQTRRFFPTYQKIRQLIADQELGELRSITYHDGVEFDWPAASPHHFQPGAKGAWSDTGVHLLDSVCYWLGATPELIDFRYDSFGGPEAMATASLSHGACEIEIKVSRLGRLSNSFTIVGSRGQITAEAEDWDEFTVEYVDGRRKRFKCGSNRVQYTDFAKPCLENFVSVIAGTDEPSVSGESTLGTIEVLMQAYDIAQQYSMPWNDHWYASHGGQSDSASAWKRDGSPKRVLVTGASGFLGGRIVEAMNLSGFAQPVAMIRHWSRAARIARFPSPVVLADILDPSTLDAAVQSADAIVHCAYGGDHESIVEGTRNLLAAAAKHGVGKVVYLSSAEVYGASREGTVHESDGGDRTGNDYGDAKLEAESVCREFAEHGVRTTILRPSLIYGPFSESWSMDVAERLQSGKWGLFDELGEGRANLIYVDDLVLAIFAALGSMPAGTQTFNVNGEHPPTWNEYFARFNQELGLAPLRKISTSKAKLRTKVIGAVRQVTDAIKERFEDRLMEIYLRGGFASRMMKLLKGELDTTPSSTELHDLFARRAIYSDDAIRQKLRVKPTFELTRGLKATHQWLIHHELAK